MCPASRDSRIVSVPSLKQFPRRLVLVVHFDSIRQGLPAGCTNGLSSSKCWPLTSQRPAICSQNLARVGPHIWPGYALAAGRLNRPHGIDTDQSQRGEMTVNSTGVTEAEASLFTSRAAQLLGGATCGF